MEGTAVSGGDNQVWWRGVQLDARSAAMMDEVVRLCPGIDIQPSNGSWSGYGPSAGTHAGAGAVDIKAAGLTPLERSEVVESMRVVGWAAWLRTPYQSDWPWHIHGVAVGCPGLSSAAADQVADYRQDRNGLASNLRDDGPRTWPVVVGRTWEEYRAQLQPGQPPAPEEEDVFMIEAPARGVALVGIKHYRGLTAEMRDSLSAAGVRLARINEREFDLIRDALS